MEAGTAGGRSDFAEAAISGVYFNNWESHAGVTGGKWRPALPARGAGSREQPKEDRGKFAMLTFPLSPLGFPTRVSFASRNYAVCFANVRSRFLILFSP